MKDDDDDNDDDDNNNNNNSARCWQRTINKNTWYSVCSITLYVGKEIGVKLDNEHWYDHVETSREAKINMLWNKQM